MSDKNKYRVRLVRWGDSSSSGRTVTFKLPDDGDEHPFKGLDVGAKNGQLLELEVAVYDGVGDVETLGSTKKPRTTENPRLPVVQEESSGTRRRRATMKNVTRRVIPAGASGTDAGSAAGSDDGESPSARPGTSGSGKGSAAHGNGTGMPEPSDEAAAPDDGSGNDGGNLNSADLDGYANQMGQAAEALAAVAERLDEHTDDDEPRFPTIPIDADADLDPGVKAVRRATDLCKAIDKQRAGFYYFMRSRYPQAPKLPPEDGQWSRDAKSTRDRVCLHCEAENLTKLAEDPDARRKFEELENEFERHERLR